MHGAGVYEYQRREPALAKRGWGVGDRRCERVGSLLARFGGCRTGFVLGVLAPVAVMVSAGQSARVLTIFVHLVRLPRNLGLWVWFSMTESPKIRFVIDKSLIPNDVILYAPAIDRDFFPEIGGVIICASWVDLTITEYLRCLVNAVPDPSDAGWERASFSFRVKRAKIKTRRLFAGHPNSVVELCDCIEEMKRLQQVRNHFAHGLLSSSFPADGTAPFLEVHYRDRKGTNTCRYTPRDLRKTYHEMMILLGRFMACFNDQPNGSTLPSADKRMLQAFVAKYHPRGTIQPTT